MNIRKSRREFLKTTGGVLAGMTIASMHVPRTFAAAGGVTKEPFGKMPDGTRVDLFTLTNEAGTEVKIINFGATLVTIKTMEGTVKTPSLCLHFDTLEDYVKPGPLFGAVVGRYANRIAGAKFAIDGTEYKLVANAGQNHIHGGAGKEAFHKVVWKAETMREGDTPAVRLTHVSRDGEAGYPGTLEASVVYKLTSDNRLILDYTAKTDKPTHLNLTNHAYWNLAGAGAGDVLGHVMQLNADKYLVADKARMPTGEIRRVDGTAMDFRKAKAIGVQIDQVEDANYDHCYVLNKGSNEEAPLAARVVEPKGGRMMEVYTSQPGVQFYTAKGLSNRFKAGDKSYGAYHGFCLETQHYPDAPNHPGWPSTLLRPGELFHEMTVFKFGKA